MAIPLKNSLKFLSVLMVIILFINPVVCQVKFNSLTIEDIELVNPTSLQFGPDNRLYIAEMSGIIKVFRVNQNSEGSYNLIKEDQIELVKQIPNHDDDGSVNSILNKRLVTGIHISGTTVNPVIYVSSSDPRTSAGQDKNLCTNSGIISKIYKEENTWKKLDLVRGLPRSEEAHLPNGLVYDEATKRIYVVVGGNTNAGAPSLSMAYTNEYALSAAILSIDIETIEALPTKATDTNHPYKYDIPTLDDPTRENNPDGSDINDPWGGNDGLNQGKIVEGGPVQIFATGLRNTYDLIITKTEGQKRNLWVTDNGPNIGYGGYPDGEGTSGTVTNRYNANEPGSVDAGINDERVNNLDGLHLIGNLDSYIPGTYYAGHPCPIRANPTGAGLYTHDGDTGIWRNGVDPNYPLPADWPPVPVSMSNSIEGDYQNPGKSDASLLTFPTSTNGIVEYTASSFNKAMKGDILAVGFNGAVYWIRIDEEGKVLNEKGNNKLILDTALAKNIGVKPLDITSMGDTDPFPGTIWIAGWASSSLHVLVPEESGTVNIKEPKDIPFQVIVYPNPSSGHITVQFEKIKNKSPLHFSIINSAGEIIKQGKADPKGMKLSNLEFKNIPSGIYQILISNGEEEVTKKFIIENY